MLVSRNALQSWPTLAGENNPFYFSSRVARNEYFSINLPSSGQYCAIASNGSDPASVDWDAEIWEIDQYNGKNWATIALDSNFALIVTNEGILALTDADAGGYKFEISRIAIKQTKIAAGTNVAEWSSDSFFNSDDYIDICLDTNNRGNTGFTLEDSLTYRTNLLNGGIQFTINLEVDCMGQQLAQPNSNAAPTLYDYNVAAIGLFVKDQRDPTAKEVLFAVANLPQVVQKHATTPNTIGNNLKFYLNTTLSNLGNVCDLQTIMSSVGSVPEVATEEDLIDKFDYGTSAPYNLYLVDNLYDTNVPAIAVRKGNPLSTTYPVNWTYFTPNDDNIEISSDLIDQSLKSYMIAGWDGTRYLPADSSSTMSLSGLYIQNNLIYAGKVTNRNIEFIYNFDWDRENSRNYRVNDVLTVTLRDPNDVDIKFLFTVVAIDPSNGKVLQLHATPSSGNNNVSCTNKAVVYDSTSAHTDGTGLKVTITSEPMTNITWNFPSSWVNKPLYVDYDHSNNHEPAGVTWESYCADAGLPTTTNKNRKGLLTCVDNEFTVSHFVGWCVNENTIKLGLDLRNEASETVYGTTRYATNAEVRDVHGNQEAASSTAVTPETLNANYLPIYNVSGNRGATRNNQIVVDTYTKFTKTIVGEGNDVGGVAFKGTAYRALWEDLAEFYRSDLAYPAGTLICIGSGIAEITRAVTECNGIISTNPGYQLGNKEDKLDLPVALVGKIPVLFANDCMPIFGDRIYLSKTEPGKASTIPNGKCLGKIIDKREHLDQYGSLLCSVRIDF